MYFHFDFCYSLLQPRIFTLGKVCLAFTGNKTMLLTTTRSVRYIRSTFPDVSSLIYNMCCVSAPRYIRIHVIRFIVFCVSACYGAHLRKGVWLCAPFSKCVGRVQPSTACAGPVSLLYVVLHVRVRTHA